MKALTLIFTLSIFSSIGQSSIEISIPDSNQLSIQNIVKSLQGDGLIIQNIKTNQKIGSNQLAKFKDAKQTIGMQEGLLLSTGSVLNVESPNLFSGMTGQVTSTPTLNYDTIVNQVPCNSELSQVPQNFVTYIYSETAESVDIEIMNSIKPWDSIAYKKPTVGASKLSVGPQYEKTQASNTYTSTIILPKNQTFKAYPGDADLEKELGNGYTTYDACVVEADIIPLGDTLSFKYLFGSEEYDEYVCSPFNDAFAFYISGPGIEGMQNMAVLSSGSRVNVNAINNGNPYKKECVPSNPSFYNKNNGQIPLEYDGFTRTLEIVQKVEPFKVYHLKMVIADASDGLYDSGVFIESSSILSYNKRFTIPFNTNISALNNETRAILMAMSSIAKGHEDYVLEISGHSDNMGSESFNYNLAQNRINSVIDFIKAEGFSDDIIRTINKGETMPIATNLTAIGRAKNRRVEIKLVPTYQTNKNQVLDDIELINYPNPTTDFTTIKAKANTNIEKSEIMISDINGHQISTHQLINGHVTIDVSNLIPGVYIYSLMLNNNTLKTSKMVVAK